MNWTCNWFPWCGSLVFFCRLGERSAAGLRLSVWGCRDLQLIRRLIWCIHHITRKGYANNSSHQASWPAQVLAACLSTCMFERLKACMGMGGRTAAAAAPDHPRIHSSEIHPHKSSLLPSVHVPAASRWNAALSSAQPLRCRGTTLKNGSDPSSIAASCWAFTTRIICLQGPHTI